MNLLKDSRVDRPHRRSIATFRNGLLSTSFMPSTTTSTALKILFIVMCCWSGDVVHAARSPPTPIVVNKCCRNGEQLDANQQCLIGSNEHWWPPIFMINKQDYFKQPGEAPRFFKVRERWPPSCEHMELITGNHNIALFSNGTLYLSERKTTIESDSFCVDKDAALVCFNRPQGMDSLRAPVALTKIRKCCAAENAIFDTTVSSCVPFAITSRFAPKKLIQNASAIEFLFGLPHCDKEDFVVAGTFNESKLNTTTGTLSLPEREFRSDQYCLEHFNDSDTIEVNVMTCGKYLTPTVEQVSVWTVRRITGEPVINQNIILFFLSLLDAGSEYQRPRSPVYDRCGTFNFGGVPHRHIGHRIFATDKSSCAALALSDVLRCFPHDCGLPVGNLATLRRLNSTEFHSMQSYW